VIHETLNPLVLAHRPRQRPTLGTTILTYCDLARSLVLSRGKLFAMPSLRKMRQQIKDPLRDA
jgi:hypothetical protein